MENQKDKVTSNFFLLLKQGFKGIFRFRVQFIIILILSFLATLVLTISVSTSRRLESAYQKIVKKIDPFDLVGSTRISDTATANSGGAAMTDFRSTAITDFINNTFINVLDQNEDGTPINNSNYNFIFNGEAYKDTINHAETFLTKVMDSQANNSFYQVTLTYYENLNQLDPAAPTYATDLANAKNKYRWNLKESFADQLIKDLISYRDNPQLATVGYLKNTSFGFLLRNDPHFLDFVGRRFVKANFYNFNPDQKRFIRYLYWIGAQVGAWITDQESIFGTVKSEANGTMPPSIFDPFPGINPSDKTEVFYEFLLGKPYKDTPAKQPNFIIKDDKSNLYNLQTTMYEKWDGSEADKYLIVDQANQTGIFGITNRQRTELMKKGFKGITSPLSVTVGEIKRLPGQDPIDPYQGITTITFTQNTEEFSLLNPNSNVSLTKKLNLERDFSYDYDIMDEASGGWNITNGDVQASMMQYHVEFNALSSGFNVRFRKESVVFDNITSRKFRFVILNARDDANFTVLRGTAPTAINEVAISQQFAQKNKIKIGQYLAVGGALVMVTGFASDAFSFFPNVDPDFPIPQPKTEAVIFGSKATLTKIHKGNGNSSDGQNADPQMFTFFLTNNKKANLYDLATKKNLFTSLQMDLATQIKNDVDYLDSLITTKLNQQKLVADEIVNTPLESFFNLKNFSDSNYRLSWTLMPLVLTTFQTITYIASAIIAIIAIIALVICIRKTINFNAKQIGILKAMGTNPWMIAVTYLAHSIVIIAVIVPSAWIIGTGLQVPFSMLFTQYFSAPTNIVLVDWISIVIALFGFGISAIVISMIAAYLVTRKPVVDIINVSVKWSNSKLIDKLNTTAFKNASFNYRFSLTLLSSGKKPVALLVTVVGLTSLLISGAIAVPAVADNVINSYYKSIKYANAYDNITPTVNSPLSKTAVNFWQGNEKWDQNWEPAELKLDATNTPYGYYLDPEGYMDSASQASPIPRYIFKKDEAPTTDPKALVQNFTYAYAYLLKYPGMFLSLASNAFGNNFFTVLGQTFNIGTIDQFFGLILNSNYETLRQVMGDHYDESKTLDANKQQLAFEFSGALTLALPNIISLIFQATSGGEVGKGDGNNWKKDVIDVIMTQVPPYVRSYLQKSDSRTEQFSISFNSEPFVPKKETFVTKFTAQTDQYGGVPITGIDDNQTAFVMKKEAHDRLFLDNETLEKVEKIFNGDGSQVESFSTQGIKIWDKATATLTLPMLDNHQSATGYKLKKNGQLTNIKTTTRQLEFRTKDGWQVLPKNAWAYDDSDFWNSDLFHQAKETLKLQDPDLPNGFNENYQEAAKNNGGSTPENDDSNGNHSSWLDIYALENSRFTYNLMFDKSDSTEMKLNDESYFFNDFSFDENHQISGSFARPYYNYRNVKLFLPVEMINEDDILKSSANSSKIPEGTDDKWSYFYHTDATTKMKLENGMISNEYMVPNSVLNAWGLKREDNPKFLVINPYDLKYGEKGETGGLDRLITGEKYPYWGRYAFDSDYGPGALSYNNEEPIVYGAYKPDNERTDFKINFQVVGTIDSYDSRLLLTDATLANMILGYSTARTVGASNTYLVNPHGPDLEHNQGERPWKDELNTFDFNRPQLDVLVQSDRKKLASLTYLKNLADANNYQPLKWHTGKLSNIDEPVNLTSAVSFNVRDNLGFYSLGLMFPLDLGVNVLVTNQTLLSTQKALMNQIYSLAISLGALLIVAIVLTASLLIMLVGDVYIAQYLRFMILMRALGYSNRAIHSYAFGAVSILSLAMWIITTIVAWVLIFGFIKLMAIWGFAIPYALSWWPPLVSFAIIFISFFGSLLVSSGKVRRGEVSSLVNESNE